MHGTRVKPIVCQTTGCVDLYSFYFRIYCACFTTYYYTISLLSVVKSEALDELLKTTIINYIDETTLLDVSKYCINTCSKVPRVL